MYKNIELWIQSRLYNQIDKHTNCWRYQIKRVSRHSGRHWDKCLCAISSIPVIMTDLHINFGRRHAPLRSILVRLVYVAMFYLCYIYCILSITFIKVCSQHKYRSSWFMNMVISLYYCIKTFKIYCISPNFHIAFCHSKTVKVIVLHLLHCFCLA